MALVSERLQVYRLISLPAGTIRSVRLQLAEYMGLVSIVSGTSGTVGLQLSFNMGLVSVVYGTFGTVRLQLPGIYGACVCRSGDIWSTGSSAVVYMCVLRLPFWGHLILWDFSCWYGGAGGGKDSGEEI